MDPRFPRIVGGTHIPGPELVDVTLDAYEPTEVIVDCRRCRRRAPASCRGLKEKYGNPTMGELARLIAADANPPCNLAGVEGQVLCSAIPEEPPVESWAYLLHAVQGGWVGRLRCQRRHAGLKSTKSCPGSVRLHLPSLIAALHWDFPLERLPRRLECPECSSKLVSIEWEVPPRGAPTEPQEANPYTGERLYRAAPLRRVPGR